MKLNHNCEDTIKRWREMATDWEVSPDKNRLYLRDEREMAAAVYRKCAADLERALGVCECLGVNDYDKIIEHRDRMESAMSKLQDVPNSSPTAWHD